MLGKSDRCWSHCAFLAGGAAAAAFAGRPSAVASAEPPPETTRIRLPRYTVDLACTAPQWVAEDLLVGEGFTKHQDYALQALKAIPYNRWRDYDSADTVRFYALRMHEAGLIKTSPQKLMATGTDWRFINELKKELKG